jgi:ATP-dependent DNA helicase RecG
VAEISWKRKPGQKLAPLAERLKKLGLVSDWDFVLHLPLRYEDETSITPIEELEVGVDAQVEGVVTNNSDNRFGNFEAWVDDETDMLKVYSLLPFYSRFTESRETCPTLRKPACRFRRRS